MKKNEYFNQHFVKLILLNAHVVKELAANLEVKKAFFPNFICTVNQARRHVNDEAKCTPYANQNKYDGNQCQSFLCF